MGSGGFYVERFQWVKVVCIGEVEGGLHGVRLH